LELFWTSHLFSFQLARSRGVLDPVHVSLVFPKPFLELPPFCFLCYSTLVWMSCLLGCGRAFAVPPLSSSRFPFSQHFFALACVFPGFCKGIARFASFFIPPPTGYANCPLTFFQAYRTPQSRILRVLLRGLRSLLVQVSRFFYSLPSPKDSFRLDFPP